VRLNVPHKAKEQIELEAKIGLPGIIQQAAAGTHFLWKSTTA